MPISKQKKPDEQAVIPKLQTMSGAAVDTAASFMRGKDCKGLTDL
jgi:hypothetical protein